MANQQRSITATLRAEIGQYKTAMQEAAQATEKVRGSADGLGKSTNEVGKTTSRSAQQIRQDWSAASKPLLAVGGAITAVGAAALKTGVQYNQLQQSSRAALTTLLGSAQAANAQMDKLDEFARSSPFAKQTFITAQQQMLAFGIEAQKVVPYLDAIQDAVAASGGSNQQLQEVAYVMSQISAAGKITATDLMQLGQRGINAAELIGDSMGKTGAQIRADITSGALGADEALDALAKGMNSRFDGAAENVKNTFSGALDRVMAAWRDFSSMVAEPFVGTEGGGIFTGLLNELADVMRAFQELPTGVQVAAVGLTGLVGAGSLAAGTFLMLAPRIVETQQAMATLKTTMPGTHAAITRAGKAATIAAAAFAALSIAGTFMSSSDAGSGVNEMTAGILGLADGSERLEGALNSAQWDTRMMKGLDGLAGTISDADRATSGLNKTLGVVNMNFFEDSAADVENYDSALAKLVGDGKLDEAARGARFFYEEAERGGVPLERAQDMLKQYQDALAGVELEQQSAAATSGNLSEAMQSAWDVLADPSAAVQASESIGEVIAAWREQTEAASRFAANSAMALRMGLDPAIIDQFAEQGVAGMALLDQAVAGGQGSVDDLNAAYGGLTQTTGDLREAMDSLPSEVFTEFGTPGADEAIDKAVEVADKYNLTPDQVETFLRALDFASPDIATVHSRLSGLDGRYAMVRVLADTAPFRAAIASLPGMGSPLSIAVGVAAVAAQANAIGGFYDGGVRAFAGGGVDERGRSVPRVPQMRSGSQGAVLWGEQETGWEAYVSGKPGMQSRNRAVLGEAASRLGGDVTWYASGGITGAPDPVELSRMRIRVRDLERDLRATGQDRLRGWDRDLALNELAEAKRELSAALRAKARIPRGHTWASYNEATDRGVSLRDQRMDESAWSSPASFERRLGQMIVEQAQFTQALADLKRKGASPWLLDQLIQVGPSKSSIRTAKQLAQDTARLKRLNSLATQWDQQAYAYGHLVADPKFFSAGAANLLTGREQQWVNQAANITVNSVDPDRMAREVARLSQHYLTNQAEGAGV